MVMQFFFFGGGGGGEVQYGLYESSEYQISHRFLSWTLRLVGKNPFRVRGWWYVIFIYLFVFYVVDFVDFTVHRPHSSGDRQERI